MEKKKVNLAKIVLAYLLKTYTTTQKFSAPDLYDLCRQHGQSPKSSANNMLRALVRAGCVYRTDDVIENYHGGSDMPLYQLTGKQGLDETYNRVIAHQQAMIEQYNKLNGCQLELQKILNKIVESRQREHAA